MKLMIGSDIHGSAYYCREMVKAFEREGADKLLLLGDILYHGPRNDLPKEYAPKEVITLLNGMKDKILAVRGNCDSEVDQMVLEFPIMAEYCVLYISDKTIYAAHGHKDTVKPAEGDVFLSGHTHIPLWERRDGVLYLNPGSVSIPKNGSEHSYMIIEDNKILWKNMNGEIYNEILLTN